jgi:hypothetical protein
MQGQLPSVSEDDDQSLSSWLLLLLMLLSLEGAVCKGTLAVREWEELLADASNRSRRFVAAGCRLSIISGEGGRRKSVADRSGSGGVRVMTARAADGTEGIANGAG